MKIRWWWGSVLVALAWASLSGMLAAAELPPLDVAGATEITLLIHPQSAPADMPLAAWAFWLGDQIGSPYAARDAVALAIESLAARGLALQIETDAPHSDLLLVTGDPLALQQVQTALAEHPLVASIAPDTPEQRAAVRAAWDVVRGPTLDPPPAAAAVNVRHPWAANAIWGQMTASDAPVTVTVTRAGRVFAQIAVSTAADGRYAAFTPGDLRAGDVIAVQCGAEFWQVRIPAPAPISDAATGLVQGRALPARPLEVVLGHTLRATFADVSGDFTLAFAPGEFRPGARGFTRQAVAADVFIYAPFQSPVLNVRRDISGGIPWDSAHVMGIASVVWGSAQPEAQVVITLTQGTTSLTRAVQADATGEFALALGREIRAGDHVRVWDGQTAREVHVPLLRYHADPVAETVTGAGPSHITNLLADAPHTLAVQIGWTRVPVTTTDGGFFRADFAAAPFHPTALGALRYTTRSGDRVYQPLWAVDVHPAGQPGDWWADVILGQPDLAQVTPNEVRANRVFNPGGVLVDRTATPNRVYVFDSGNNRILGLTHLGVCAGGAQMGQPCSAASDCPGSACSLDETRPADLILGQPTAAASACNGDSAYRTYPEAAPASATTLCGSPEYVSSVSESGSDVTLAVDAQGHLYVPDVFNHRVLRYDDPFNTNVVADYVWGQDDFAGTACNRGQGFGLRTDARSLCLARPPGYGDLRAGVAVDAGGNLWVADNMNHRVLRFPFDAGTGAPRAEADLVLGQAEFTTTAPGAGLAALRHPASVRVNAAGVVYVADSANNRVLVFAPPLTSGMAATSVLTGVVAPYALELAPDGSLWVNDSGNARLKRFVAGVLMDSIPSIETRGGGVGVDADGNLLFTGWDSQEVLRFTAPMWAYTGSLLRAESYGTFNATGPRDFYGGLGFEVTDTQLIFADGSRLLFWNDPAAVVDYQPAAGVVGAADFVSRNRWGPFFGRMRADDQGRLWVLRGEIWQGGYINAYTLPLETQASPILTLTSPITLAGGGVFTWTQDIFIGGLAWQPGCDCLWVSDKNTHRVFRIRDASTQPEVDVVLGQVDVGGVGCNQGRGGEFPAQDSLCYPGALTFDPDGNLFVADHNLEVLGNFRLLAFAAESLPAPGGPAVFGLSATRVFGSADDFALPGCLPRAEDPLCAPWEPTFDSAGRMVLGFNAYLGPRFLLVYDDPWTDALPTAAVGEFHSMPLSARFDAADSLYVMDHNRYRILIYRQTRPQTFALTGTVQTAAGLPVAGVEVTTADFTQQARTDARGVYTFTGLLTGTVTLHSADALWNFTPYSRTVTLPAQTGALPFVIYPWAQDFQWIYLPLVVRRG